MKDCPNPRCGCGDCQCSEGCRCDHRAYPYPTPFPVPYMPYYKDLALPPGANRFQTPPAPAGVLPYIITP